MKKFLLVFFIVIVSFSNIFSQSTSWRIEYDTARANFVNGKPELTAKWLENFLPAYKQNLKDTSQYFEMIHLLARCYMKLSKNQEAEQLFNEDINYFKKNPEEISKSTYTASIIYLGYLYYQRRQFDEAEKYFTEAIELKRRKGENTQQYLILLNNLAIINYAQRDYAKSDSIYKKILALKKELYGVNHREYSNTLTTMGNLCKKTGRYGDAEPLYSQALSIKKLLVGEKHPEYIAATNNLASLYLTQGRYDMVEPMYKNVLEISKEIYTPQQLEYTNAMNNVAILYESMGRFSEAEVIFQEVLTILESNMGHNNLDYTDALINLATLYKTMSDYKKSEAFYLSALSIYEVIIGEEHETYVGALVNLAGLYRSMGRLQEAEPLYNKALRIYKKTAGENNIPYANLLNNIALYYDEIGQYEQSEIFYKKALTITKDLIGDNHPQYATTLNNMAQLYKNTGHFEQSEPLYLQSASIRKATLGEKHQDYAASLNNLASLYESMGRPDEAEPLYLHALKIVKDLFGLKNPYYANSLNNLAGLYQNLKRYDEAEKLYKESLEITGQILGEKHPSFAITLNNLALLQQQKGDYKQSEKLYIENLQKTKEALGVKHPNYAVSLSNLAGLYEHMGRYPEAEKLYFEALQIRKNALGDKHPSYTLTLSSLARLLAAIGKFESADTLWEKAINNYLYEISTYFPSMSEKEKGQFYQTISNEFETYNSYALLRAPTNPKVLSQMYNNQLATKALLLNSSNKLRHRILASKDSSLVKMFKQWMSEKELLSKIYALSKDEIQKQHINVDSIEHVANEVEKKLSLKSEIFKKNEVSFYTWHDIQKHLRNGEAAIEIIRFFKYKFDSAGVYTDSVYYAALIVKHGISEHPEIVVMNDGNRMEGKFLSVYKNSVRFKVHDEISYNNFWKEIQGKLTDIKKVYLSPDGIYNQISLNTLKNPVTGKFVLEEVDLRLVTNTKDLITQKYVTNPKKQIVLFGNPNYLLETTIAKTTSEAIPSKDKYNDYLSTLPGTEVEVTKINDAVSSNSWQSKLYVGSTATEKNIKNLISPKVIHIATHGFFEKDAATNKGKSKKATENPLVNSGLMLAGASVSLYNKEHNIFNSEQIETRSEDGILTAYEAMNLNLDHTDLVVLSACETGLGEIKNGEGVYGLQRAFIIAGAKSIIISLWKVDDATTQKLMTYFYQEWIKTDNKNLAFKKAQLKLKEEFSDPYYWGAFIMVQ